MFSDTADSSPRSFAMCVQNFLSDTAAVSLRRVCYIIYRCWSYLTMAASQLPQELIDTIINNVEDARTLHSCSRVALSWVTSSQRLLFHFISIAPSQFKFSSQNDLVSRLRKTFNTSPHLANHVRILELDPSQVVPYRTEPLFALLSRLEEVRVVDFEDAPMFACPQHHPFHSLLALPGVTRLTIGPGAWYLGDVMPCLRTGQNLRELTLEDVIFEGYGYGVCWHPCLPAIGLEQLTIRRGFVGLLAELNGIPGMDLSRLKCLSVLLGVRNAQTTMRWRNRAPISAISDVLKANDGMLEHLSLDVFLARTFPFLD